MLIRFCYVSKLRIVGASTLSEIGKQLGNSGSKASITISRKRTENERQAVFIHIMHREGFKS